MALEAEISGNLECEGCEITGNRSAVEGHMMAKGMALDFDESHGPGIIGFFGWLFMASLRGLCRARRRGGATAYGLGGQQG